MRRQAGHRVDHDRDPQRGPPARPAAQVDDRGVGDQPGQRRVQRGEAGGFRPGRGDRVVQLAGRAAPQHGIGQTDQGRGGQADDQRLRQPPGLVADQLADGQRHRQQHQGQHGGHPEQGEHAVGQPQAGPDHVGLHAVGGRLGQQPGRHQQGDPGQPGHAAQQVGGPPDPPGQPVLDHRRGGALRPGARLASAGLASIGLARYRAGRCRAAAPRRGLAHAHPAHRPVRRRAPDAACAGACSPHDRFTRPATPHSRAWSAPLAPGAQPDQAAPGDQDEHHPEDHLKAHVQEPDARLVLPERVGRPVGRG